jgi:hypothetical protein
MPLVWSFKQQPYPLITGITGIQGEDAPETSGPWELVCNAQSYGEAFNAVYPYRTLWGAFAGAGHEFATAQARPAGPWHIGAVLRAGTVSVDRLEFAHRAVDGAAMVTQCSAEIAQRAGGDLRWSRLPQVKTDADGRVSIRIGPVRCAGVRLRVDSISAEGEYPGISGFQLYGFF